MSLMGANTTKNYWWFKELFTTKASERKRNDYILLRCSEKDGDIHQWKANVNLLNFLLKFILKFLENSHFYGYSNREIVTFLWIQQQSVATKQCTHSFVLSSNCGNKCFHFGLIWRYKYKLSNHRAHSEAEHRTTNKRNETRGKKEEVRCYQRVIPLSTRW